MKKIWILNHYAQEPSGAGGTRHYSLARHLLTHGWTATVIAASTDFNTGRQRLSDRESNRITDYDGVRFLRVRTPAYKGNGGARMLNMLSYMVRVLLPSTTKVLPRPDVIIGSSVHPFAALSGALLADRFNIPFVFEVRDLWPQTLVDLGRLKKASLVTHALHMLEKWLYHRADRIIVLLQHAYEYIVPLGVSADKIVWIPNGVELDGYPEPAQPVVRDIFKLMYFGSHGQANGLDTLLKAMALLRSRSDMGHVRLHMIGDGPLKLSLMAMANDLNLNNVKFFDPVPKQEIPSLAAEADAFVICVKDLPRLYKFGISMNKLFDYMAAARPTIIASAAVNNPIQDAGAGLTVRPENPLLMAEAIAKIAHMSAEQRAVLGRAGRAYVEQNHAFDSLAARLANTLNSVVSQSQCAPIQ